VEQWTVPRRRDEVAQSVAAAGIPSAPVRTLPEVGSDPHVFERGLVREVDYPTRGMVKVIGNPIKLSTHEEPEVTAPPRIGEHTDAILHARLGISTEEIAELRSVGAI
jgi:crotonobetainyl-CoA:carnitine CoA-transferase CaiB-like acyl-CoA transferase